MREFCNQLVFKVVWFIGKEIVVRISHISLDIGLFFSNWVVVPDKIENPCYQTSRATLIKPVNGTIKSKIFSSETSQVTARTCVHFKHTHGKPSTAKKRGRGQSTYASSNNYNIIRWLDSLIPNKTQAFIFSISTTCASVLIMVLCFRTNGFLIRSKIHP